MQTYHLSLRYYCCWGGGGYRLSPQPCGAGTVRSCCLNTWQTDWRGHCFRSCSGVKQWMITGIRERTWRVLAGRSLSPARFEVVMDWGSWGVVRRWWRWQGWMEGHKRVRICKHGFCSGVTANSTSPRLPHCQEWTFISKTFIRKELVRILRKNGGVNKVGYLLADFLDRNLQAELSEYLGKPHSATVKGTTDFSRPEAQGKITSKTV